MTSLESASSCIRRAMRRLVLARMLSLTAPCGRWVASSRCTPRLRPRWATPTRASMKSGSSALSVANSSITTSSRGSGSGGPCAGSRAGRWRPTARSTRSRCFSSASRQRRARSARCSSRSVTMPTVCGSRAHSSKALPPLKSTSTNVRWSGSTPAARPATIVRSSSDLPAPVVPPTRPWGPSATKSIENTPSSATPDRRDAGRGSGPAAFHRASTASGVHSSRSSSGSRRIVAGSPAPTMSSSGSSKRASARAQSRATSSAMPAGAKPRTCVPTCGRVRSAAPSASVISTTAVHTAGSRSTRGGDDDAGDQARRRRGAGCGSAPAGPR